MVPLTKNGIIIQILNLCETHNFTIDNDKINLIRSSETEARLAYQYLIKRFGTKDDKYELKRIIKNGWKYGY